MKTPLNKNSANSFFASQFGEFEIDFCDYSDKDLLILLENECFSAPYSPAVMESILKNPLSTTLKVTQNGSIIAYIALEKALDEAELIKIAVKPSHRRIGIAKNLLSFAFNTLKNQNINKLFLEVDETNIQAINLYKNCEFCIIARREKYYGDRTAVIMQKNL